MSGGQSATEASSLPSAMRGASRRSLSSMSAASAALAFDTSRLDAARLPVVVEIGERLTKVGYANELVPRAIIRTEFLDDLLQRQRDVIRVEEQEPVDDNPLVPPPKPYNKLYHFILKLYMSILLTTPHDRRVVVVESVLASSKLRRALATIFLERLEAVSLLFVPSHLTATFPFNVKTALVIDLGYREAVAIPVAEGVTLLNQLEVTTRSTKRLEDRTRDLLYAHGRVQLTDGSFRELSDDDKKRIEELNIVEDIVVRFLYVTTVERGRRIQSGEKNEQDAPDVRLPFRHEFLIIPGFVREAAAEVLFEEKPNETELVDEPTLPQLVHNTIARCTIDLRTKLFGSLLFVGGLSKLQGLLARLKQEIIELGTQKGLKNAGPDHVKFIFSKDPGFELYANWLGGSMFGSLTDVSQLRSVVTREDWQQRRTLPDWTDFIAASEKAVDGKGRV